MQTILAFVKEYFVFMLVLFLISYLVPRESYRKYFHFFIGALMVAVLMEPVLSFFNRDARGEFHRQLEEIEKNLSEIEYEEKGEDIFEQFLKDPGVDGKENGTEK